MGPSDLLKDIVLKVDWSSLSLTDLVGSSQVSRQKFCSIVMAH